MKLNPDCIRGLLLVLEEQPRQINAPTVIKDPTLSDYSRADVEYALEKLIEAGLVNGRTHVTKSCIVFTLDSISVTGHKFLDDIRSPKLWSKIKGTASDLGMTSIKSLIPIATKVGFDFLSQHLTP